jgi:hypothetical protein
MQPPNDFDLATLVEQMSKSSYAGVASAGKWNDTLASVPGGIQKTKP